MTTSYSALKKTRLTIGAPGVLKNDTDADNDLKNAVLVTGVTAAQGTLTLLPNGSLTFSPAKGFAGMATFTYRAVDATGLTSNTATVKIDVGTKDQDKDGKDEDKDGKDRHKDGKDQHKHGDDGDDNGEHDKDD